MTPWSRSALVVGLALAWACGQSGAPPTPEAAGDDSQRSAAIEVAELPASDHGSRGHVAVIAPVQAVDVVPRVNGELLDVAVRAGDTVVTGDVVARLDPRRLREEHAVARAALASARAALGQAEVDIADAERVVAIEERAVAAGTSAQHKLDEARFALQRARAARDSALAAVAEENARVNQTESRLADADIKAPFSGTVAIRYRDLGAAVGPGQPVIRLIGVGGLRVVFAVPPEDVSRLLIGQEVEVDIETVADTRRARIRQIAPELDPASKLFFVEAELDAPAEPDSDIKPGLAAWVRPVISAGG